MNINFDFSRRVANRGHGVFFLFSYGQEKSAAEMVFSYGFLDATRDMALWLVLGLQGLPDDPLGFAKQAVFKSAPTLRIYDLGDTVEWTSHFIWFVIHKIYWF